MESIIGKIINDSIPELGRYVMRPLIADQIESEA